MARRFETRPDLMESMRGLACNIGIWRIGRAAAFLVGFVSPQEPSGAGMAPEAGGRSALAIFPGGHEGGDSTQVLDAQLSGHGFRLGSDCFGALVPAKARCRLREPQDTPSPSALTSPWGRRLVPAAF